MKENWIQLIDTIEKDPFEMEAFFALMDYVGEASDDDKRRVVQEVERRIKMIARYDADKSFRFRKFSEQEREVLDSLWSTRVKILNVMMLHPTDAEIARLGHQNDKLRELSKDAFAQGRNLWQSLLHSPSLMANEDCYDVEEHVDFSWNDEDSVLKMDNDDYYGSDFDYMIHLTDELLSTGHCKMDTIVNGASANFFGNEEDTLRELTDTLDDGTSWAEGYLHNKAYDHLCICYAMHALHTHEPWCLPDILRMDDFTVSVKLKYDRNISEQRDIRYADDGNETDPHWPEDVPCLGRTQKG